MYHKTTFRLALLGAAAIALSSCSLFGGDTTPSASADPTLSATITAAPSASPTPSPSATAEDPATPAPPSEEPEPTPDPVPVAAVITIADANGDGSVTIGGFVNGFAEDDGECTFVITKGSTTRTLDQSGLANNGTTTCGSVTFQSSQVGSGSWTARINYDGPAGQFTSDPTTVVVP